MKSLNRTIAKFTFYAVALVLLAWTATLTYTFVATALPDMPWFVPAFSLIVFDVGMIAWMVVFISYAEGSGQRAIAILACIFDMIGVGVMVLAEVLLGGQQLATAPEHLGEYAVWAIAGWTVINVVAVVLFHLSAPEARKQMALQSERDELFNAALERLTERRIDSSAALANVLSERMFDELKAELFATETHQQQERAAYVNGASPEPERPTTARGEQ